MSKVIVSSLMFSMLPFLSMYTRDGFFLVVLAFIYTILITISLSLIRSAVVMDVYSVFHKLVDFFPVLRVVLKMIEFVQLMSSTLTMTLGSVSFGCIFSVNFI